MSVTSCLLVRSFPRPRAMTETTLPEINSLPGCQEPFSSLSHFFGALIFLFLGALLLRRSAEDRVRLAFLTVYAASCLFLFVMSGLYHMMPRGGPARRVFEQLDHSAIFFLVAGTFTPIHGILFRGWLRWAPLILVWAGAFAGVFFRIVVFEDFSSWVALSVYLTLGWLGLFGYVLIARQHGLAFVNPILWGGIAYTVGGILECLGWPILLPGTIHSHDVFHVVVLLGALLHWRFIWTISRPDVQVIEQANWSSR